MKTKQEFIDKWHSDPLERADCAEDLEQVIKAHEAARFNDTTSEPLPEAYLAALIKRVEGAKYESKATGNVLFNDGLDKALEILRSTPAEVCEWKNSRSYLQPSCCAVALKNNGLKYSYTYCPFCGRKIKRT